MEHDHNYAKIPDGENNEIPSEEEKPDEFF